MQTYVFIDASNLFYGGKKSLGWSIDHNKLFMYLKDRYQVSKIYYFGGVEIYNFPFDYLKHETVPLKDLANYFVEYLELKNKIITRSERELLTKYLKKVRFYLKIETYGYIMLLKPVKTYIKDLIEIRKANCDVDMAYTLMRDKDHFDRVIILSGDGDFLPVLKYLRENNKEVLILSRSLNTAMEIKKFAGDKFLDFEFLREIIKLDDSGEVRTIK